MKWIKKLKIAGFQSHIDTQLDLVPGMNIFVGPSDSGKSAITRAIRWVTQNEPLGDGYINQKVGSALVELHMSDASRVVRTRGSFNSYIVGDETFAGFGTKVPEEVTAATGMRKALFGDALLWLSYSSQHDAPFMLSETGGQAARILGKLAGTEDLDAAGKLTNSDIIGARRHKAGQQEISSALSEKLQGFEIVDVADNLLTRCEYLYDAYLSQRAQLARLQTLRDRIASKATEISDIAEALAEITIPDISLLKEAVSSRKTHMDYLEAIGLNGTWLLSVSEQHQKVGALLWGCSKKERVPKLLESVKAVESQTALVDGLFQNKIRMRVFKQQLETRGSIIDMERLLEGLCYSVPRELKCCAYEINSRRIKIWMEQQKVFLGLSDTVKLMHNEAKYLGDNLADALAFEQWQTGLKLQNAQHLTLCKAVLSHTTEEINAKYAYEEFLTGLGVCPTCQAPMDPKRIHEHAIAM